MLAFHESRQLPTSRRGRRFQGALSLTLLVAFGAASTPAQQGGGRRAADAARAAAASASDGDFEHVDYRIERFKSAALGGRERPYAVFLPKDYDAPENAERSWPLVLWLHGMWEDHERFAERGGGAILDRMTGADEFPAAIFVCAEGDRASFWTDGVAEDAGYESMVTDDLLPHLEKRWRIDADPRRRAIAGVSMGGYGALKIALKNPGRFGAVTAHSAAILPEDPAQLTEAFPWLRGRRMQLVDAVFDSPIDAERWENANVLSLAKTLERKDVGTLKIYFDCGDEDPYGFQRTNLQLRELFEARRIPHSWREVAGGKHGWRSGYNTQNLPYALRFLAGQWAQKRAVEGLGGLLGPGKDH